MLPLNSFPFWCLARFRRPFIRRGSPAAGPARRMKGPDTDKDREAGPCSRAAPRQRDQYRLCCSDSRGAHLSNCSSRHKTQFIPTASSEEPFFSASVEPVGTHVASRVASTAAHNDASDRVQPIGLKLLRLSSTSLVSRPVHLLHDIETVLCADRLRGLFSNHVAARAGCGHQSGFCTADEILMQSAADS
jgi:hypothetical protein